MNVEIRTPAVVQALAFAKLEARCRHDSEVRPLHLFIGLLRVGGMPGIPVLVTLGFSATEMMKIAKRTEMEEQVHFNVSEPPLSDEVLHVFENAVGVCRASEALHVGVEHVLLGLLMFAEMNPESRLARVFERCGVSKQAVQETLYPVG